MGHTAPKTFGAQGGTLDIEARQRNSLAVLLAWAGLGANSLSAACYGPENSFLALGGHAELGLPLVLVTVIAVALIALAHIQMLELFPNGGGSYQVATHLLGPHAGLVAGAALLVDYVLAITVSLASGTEALFSLLPLDAHAYKLPLEAGLIVVLAVLNLRGLRLAIWLLLPVVLLFLVVHAALIIYGISIKVSDVGIAFHETSLGIQQLSAASGWLFVIALLVRACGLGGSTYCGVEAISNNVNLLAEPRVRTGRRTMIVVSGGLAFIAGGLIFLYSSWRAHAVSGETLNASVFSAILANLGLDQGTTQTMLVGILALEAAILFVAANSILIFGQSLLAHMASDSWLPHQFRNLSERLVRQNGIIFVSSCALGILVWTGGDLAVLIVYYSITVFLSLALAKAGLVRYWWTQKRKSKVWLPRLMIAAAGFLVALGILFVTVTERFFTGGWATLCLTLAVIFVCVAIRRHYDWVDARRRAMDIQFALSQEEIDNQQPVAVRREGATAVVLTTQRWGPTIHTLLWIQRLFPDHFPNIHLISAITVDARTVSTPERLAKQAKTAGEAIAQVQAFCAKFGLYFSHSVAYGTDPVEELTKLAIQAVSEFPDCVCFSNKLIFPPEKRFREWLHNQTALGLQRRLQLEAIPLVILPIKLR